MAFLNRSRSIILSRQALLPFILNALRHMSGSRLLVAGLAGHVNDSKLEEAFSRFGDIADAVVILDKDTGRSQGIGIVRFNNDVSASSAMSSMDGQVLEREIIRVRYANGSRVSEFENYEPDEKKTPYLTKRPLLED